MLVAFSALLQSIQKMVMEEGKTSLAEAFEI
jgi:hypothetical protein